MFHQNMSGEASQHTHLTKSRELIEIANRLTQEYAELREASKMLRKDSRQLSEDSTILRRISTRLIWGEPT